MRGRKVAYNIGVMINIGVTKNHNTEIFQSEVVRFFLWLYIACAYIAFVLFESSLHVFPVISDFGIAFAEYVTAKAGEFLVLFLAATAIGSVAILFRRAGKKMEVLALKGYVLTLGSIAAIHQFPSTPLNGDAYFPFFLYFAMFSLTGWGFRCIATHHSIGGGAFVASRIGRLFVIFAMAGAVAIVYYYLSRYLHISRYFQ